MSLSELAFSGVDCISDCDVVVTRLSCRQAQIYIHRPSVYAAGTVDDIEKAKDVLEENRGVSPIHAKQQLSDEKIT